MNRNKTVLLNADHSILHFISFQRAIGLFMEDKATVLEEDQNTPILHPMLGIRYPNIMALNRYVHVPYKRVRLNRRNVLTRDGYICQYCRKSLRHVEATIDHVVPKSHPRYPGPKYWENVVAACKKCNNKKDDKTPKEAGMALISKPFKPRMEDLMKCSKFQRGLLAKIRSRNMPV